MFIEPSVVPGTEGLTGSEVVGEGQEMVGPYLAALTSDAAVVITGCLVPTHDTLLVFVQVTRDIPWAGRREVGMAWAPSREAPTLSPSSNFSFLTHALV